MIVPCEDTRSRTTMTLCYRFQACNQGFYDRLAKFFRDRITEVPKICLPLTAQFKRKSRGMMGWWGGGRQRRGMAGGCVPSQVCPNSMTRWLVATGDFSFFREGQKMRADAGTQTTAQTPIWNAHISTHTRTRQPEQLYPQRAGGEINACWRRD